MNEYIPGICNIGPSERKLRRVIGLFGLFLSIMYIVSVLIIKLNKGYRMAIFFPLFMSSLGLLQDRMHFCAEFGILGIYNFSNKVNNISKVQEEFLKKDKIKALKIIGYSIFISSILTILFVLF